MLANLRKTRLYGSIPPQLRSNFINYYWDIGWWGLYGGATAAFLGIYATRVGATPVQIGLLNALPAAISLALALPSGQLVRRISAWRATWLSALISRALFLLYALVPLFYQGKAQVEAILVVAALIAIPTTVIGVSFSQLFIEAVPSDWRGTVVGVRNAAYSIISFVVTMISGQILTHLPFQLGYQIVFVIGFIGGIMTTFHLWRIRPLSAPPLGEAHGNSGSPSTATVPSVTLIGNRYRRFERLLPVMSEQGRRYLRVLAMLFFFNFTNNMIAPLVPQVLVRTLKLSDGTISVGTAANSMIVFLVSVFIARLVFHTGNRRGTSLGAALLAVQVIILALARDSSLYFLSILIGGVGSGILMTTQMNYNLDNVPAEERSLWLSWSLLLGNSALLLGALLGPEIMSFTGLRAALIVFGFLRLAVALLILKAG